jgi:anaerobic selenocysteine-containing dehydrogenase
MSMLEEVRRAIEGLAEMEKPPLICVTGLAETGEAYMTMMRGERRRLFLSPADAARIGVSDGDELDIEELRKRMEEAE